MQTLAEKQRISSHIQDIINNNNLGMVTIKSRVYFRNQERVPMFGQFIMMRDHSELWDKGMVRWLPDSKVPKAEYIGDKPFVAKEADTKILTISEIASIRNF